MTAGNSISGLDQYAYTGAENTICPTTTLLRKDAICTGKQDPIRYNATTGLASSDIMQDLVEKGVVAGAVNANSMLFQNIGTSVVLAADCNFDTTTKELVKIYHAINICGWGT